MIKLQKTIFKSVPKLIEIKESRLSVTKKRNEKQLDLLTLDIVGVFEDGELKKQITFYIALNGNKFISTYDYELSNDVDKCFIYQTLLNDWKIVEGLAKKHRLEYVTGDYDGLEWDGEIIADLIEFSVKNDFLNTDEIINKTKQVALSHDVYYNRYLPMKEKGGSFEKWIDSLSGKTKTTINSYKYALENFLEYLFENKIEDFPAFDKDSVNGFIQYLVDEKKSNSYIYRNWVAVSDFATFIGKPLNRKEIRVPKVGDIRKTSPKSLKEPTIDNIEDKLFSDLSKEEKLFNDGSRPFPNTGKLRDRHRNYVLFRLLITAGLRIQEALDLDTEDLKLDGKRIESRYVVVNRGKGDRERNVHLDTETTKILKDYLAFREKYDLRIEAEKVQNHIQNGRMHAGEVIESLSKDEKEEYYNLGEEIEEIKEKIKKETDKNKIASLKATAIPVALMKHDLTVTACKKYVQKHFKTNPALFVSNRYKRVAQNTMSQIFVKYGFNAHALRHTAIKTKVDQGVPLNKIQAFSGHNSADMILRYSQPTEEEVAEMVEKTTKKFNRKR